MSDMISRANNTRIPGTHNLRFSIFDYMSDELLVFIVRTCGLSLGDHPAFQNQLITVAKNIEREG